MTEDGHARRPEAGTVGVRSRKARVLALTSTATGHAPMIGQRLGSFQIESKIGAGAMGEVFKATQHLKDGRTRTVAVKVISAEFLDRDVALKRFTREAEILANLKHPNIVRYFAHGKSSKIYYFGMEFVEGETLDAVLERREFLPWQEVVDLGIQLCLALQFAHDQQVVHRDLKPSNLMITGGKTVKLTDFGIAKDLDATTDLTKTGRTLGTAAYMAPEQIRGRDPISHKTDLYALGCLFYQMLTGQPPFAASSAMALMHSHISDPPPRPSEKTPDVPRFLDDLVVRLMAKSPQDRPWDAAQVAHQLEELRDRTKRGERVEMAFDRARSKLAAEGGTVYPSGDGPHPVGPPTRSTSGSATRPRKTTKGKGKARPPADEEPASWLDRRTLETAGLALALVGLIGLIAYLLWPPSMETLHARAEALMASDSRPDWKRAMTEAVEPIERRFPDHPYAADFAEWRDRIALNEAEGRAVQLESPTPLGRPRADRPVEALYKTTLAEIAPLAQVDQHAMIAVRWQRFVDDLARRDDPEERGWLLLGQQRRDEQLEAVRLQRQGAANLYQQASINQRLGQVEAARSQFLKLIADYATAARGDEELLRLTSLAQDALDRLDAPDPPDDRDPEPSAPPAPPADEPDDPEPAPDDPEPSA